MTTEQSCVMLLCSARGRERVLLTDTCRLDDRQVSAYRFDERRTRIREQNSVRRRRGRTVDDQ